MPYCPVFLFQLQCSPKNDFGHSSTKHCLYFVDRLKTSINSESA